MRSVQDSAPISQDSPNAEAVVTCRWVPHASTPFSPSHDAYSKKLRAPVAGVVILGSGAGIAVARGAFSHCTKVTYDELSNRQYRTVRDVDSTSTLGAV